MNKRKVVIIGAGHVGSHCAMALAFGGVCEEIVLLDTDLEKARANAMDVADACLFTPGSCTVHVGNYDDCKTADIIVISVGQPRKPGQTRLDMLDDSVRMLRDVCSHLKPLDYQGIVITITNPADIIADFTRKSLGLPRERCFSTGTLLDTARLKRTISELSGVDRRSLTTCSLGEHGNSSLIPFSSTTIGGRDYTALRRQDPVRYGKLDEDLILERTRQIGNEIIEGKGSTEFGIGAALADMVKCILRDEHRVLPASVLLQGEYGQQDLHAGVPCVIGRDGIEDIIELPLNAAEQQAFEETCTVIRTHIARAAKVAAGARCLRRGMALHPTIHRGSTLCKKGDITQKETPTRRACGGDFMPFLAYLVASSTATAQATVAPTMGLLPIPIRPIIST